MTGKKYRPELKENDVKSGEKLVLAGRRLITHPRWVFLAAVAVLGGCGDKKHVPIVVSAIGNPPLVAKPNEGPLDPPSALLAEATAQGLVRFEASGQIEPALAQ